MATPLTELRLLNNVDLDTTYNHTFSKELFGNLAGQVSFFQAKTVSGMTFTNLTFQRKERTIKVKKTYEQIEPLTYGMFKNTTNAKWYFFFITDILYVSEQVTEIKIEIDVEQTYLFDASLGDCFVEREHVDSDDVGDHLVDENLSTGEYVLRATDTFLALNPQSICVATTYEPSVGDVVGDEYTGIYSGAKIFAFSRTTTGITALNTFLLDLTAAAKADSVVSIFMIPSALLPSYSDGEAISVPNALTTDFNYSKNETDLDGYVPKNKKLFIYPYNFLYVSNHNGSFASYRYEFSSQSNMQFYATGNVAPSPIVTLVPKYYKGAVANFDEVFRLADYPLCSWTTDAFLGYLSQNAVSAPLSIASSGLAAGTLGGVAAVAGGAAASTVAAPVAIGAAVIGIASTIGNFVEAALQPNQIKGSISGGSNTAIGIQTFAFYPKTIRAEQARIIDDFFTKYGYKVNVVKTPDTGTRSRHNYLKVQDCILKGSVPREALATMITNRVKGVTFWHVDDIGNYSPNNTIL